MVLQRGVVHTAEQRICPSPKEYGARARAVDKVYVHVHVQWIEI